MQTESNSIQIAHILLKEALQTAKIIVDATAGNGNDTLFIAQNAECTAKIFAFDIQQEALKQAKAKLLQVNLADRVQFILASHDEVNDYIHEPLDLVIFNLGYLPGGNHQVTTKSEITLKALKIMLDKLSVNGHIAVVVYPGHEEGLKECRLIKDFACSLAKKYFTVGWYQMINHKDKAPALCWIEKVGE